MAERVMRGFDILVSHARKFVESQKGEWDQTAWLDFTSDVQKLGFELSDDMMNYLSSTVESMKNLYNATTATERLRLSIEDIHDHVVSFLMKTRGVYDESEWKAFLKDLQKKGFDLTEETMSYLKEIFEAANDINLALLPITKKAEIKEMLKKELKKAEN